jgi:uncharacterized protein YndB with AHSA1/START domain
MKKSLYYKATILIQASPQEVWRALTDPAITPLWLFHCEPVTDWQTGSSLEWRGLLDGTVYVTGKVLRFEPPKLLSFTAFNPQGDYPDIPENHLTTTYTLKALRNGQVELTTAQGDFAGVADGEQRFRDAEGWQDVLEAIRTVVEENLSLSEEE